MAESNPKNAAAGNVATALIIPIVVAIVSSVGGAAGGAAVTRYFEIRGLSAAKTEIETLGRESDKLRESNRVLADPLTRRHILYQLELLRVHLATTNKNEDRRHSHTVDILGMNAFGPIHEGKRDLSELLLSGSRLRVLLLDPESKAWKERLDQEKDELNYNGAELLAALYELSEVKKRLLDKKDQEIGLEVRMYAEKPDRSLIIVDRDFPDGEVMGNRYPPNWQKGQEGFEGQSYIDLAKSEREQNDDLKRFDELWVHAVPINLPSQRFSWPFEKLKPLNGK